MLYASWVHGNAAVAEDPGVTVLRQGFGATFNIPAPPFVEPYHRSQVVFHWIHIPIPTPVLMGDSGRLKLVNVLYLCNIVGGINVAGIHLYDGKELIRAEDGLDIEGDNTDRPIQFHGYRNDLAHVMNFGLGVTLKIRSPISGEARKGQFFLAGAGADFAPI